MCQCLGFRCDISSILMSNQGCESDGSNWVSATLAVHFNLISFGMTQLLCSHFVPWSHFGLWMKGHVTSLLLLADHVPCLTIRSCHCICMVLLRRTVLLDDCQFVAVGRRHLRSCDILGLLSTRVIPRTQSQIGDRSFSVARPRLWNNLPTEFRRRDTTCEHCKR